MISYNGQDKLVLHAMKRWGKDEEWLRLSHPDTWKKWKKANDRLAKKDKVVVQ